jgi:ammonium transporter, Amt family
LKTLILGRNDPGFVYNGPLAGLVAVCIGSDIMHPLGAAAVGGIAAGIFGAKSLGGLGDVSLVAHLIGTAMGVALALISGMLVYGILKVTMGLRLTAEQEFDGADLTIRKISATPKRESNWFLGAVFSL